MHGDAGRRARTHARTQTLSLSLSFSFSITLIGMHPHTEYDHEKVGIKPMSGTGKQEDGRGHVRRVASDLVCLAGRLFARAVDRGDDDVLCGGGVVLGQRLNEGFV